MLLIRFGPCRYEEESGFRVEPFNTDMEREDGHFESGHFIEDKFKMSQRDAWLDEVADKYAHGKKQPVPKKQAQSEQDEMVEEVDPQSLLKFLVEQLKPGLPVLPPLSTTFPVLSANRFCLPAVLSLSASPRFA